MYNEINELKAEIVRLTELGGDVQLLKRAMAKSILILETKYDNDWAWDIKELLLTALKET